MFGKSSKTPMPSDTQHIDTLIGEKASFKGDLSFDGAVRIDGKFEGNIRSQKDGTLIVSESACVIGELDVPNLILHGVIHGNVRASISLQIGPKGRLNGDVEYMVVTLAEGAAINGRCNRIEDKERVKQASKQAQSASKAEAGQAPQQA
jgi:cytoskeletal protein CcmA (bactofilin family)